MAILLITPLAFAGIQFLIKRANTTPTMRLRHIGTTRWGGPDAVQFGEYQLDIGFDYRGPDPSPQPSRIRRIPFLASLLGPRRDRVEWHITPGKLIDATGKDWGPLVASSAPASASTIRLGWMYDGARNDLIVIVHVSPPAECTGKLTFETSIGINDLPPVPIAVELPTTRPAGRRVFPAP